jgi:ribokinase
VSGEGRDIDVTVLGSANLDIVLSVDAIPAPGETVLATEQAQHPGGKGLNQAVAAARAGARTVMLGALGDDDAARVLLAVARDSGVDTSHLRNEPGPSGQAFICVRPDGENSIVVASGANATVASLRAEERSAIASARVLVAQLELPVEAVRQGLSIAREASTITVLNAAPARPLDRELLELVDVLVVNSHEARTLAGVPARGAGGTTERTRRCGRDAGQRRRPQPGRRRSGPRACRPGPGRRHHRCRGHVHWGARRHAG